MLSIKDTIKPSFRAIFIIKLILDFVFLFLFNSKTTGGIE